MTTTISATELKNRVSEVLNEVTYNGNVTIIERYGKAVAKIVPLEDPKKSKEKIRRALEVTFGVLPNFPDVTKFRRSKRVKIPPLL